jgi:hypothetical protein
MTATFEWSQTHGASPGTVADLGASSGNLFNFKTNDDATAANYSSNPITASDAADGGNSKEVWIRGKFGGTFNSISNGKFWMSANFSPSTGLTVKYAASTTYATPTTDDTDIQTGVNGGLSNSATIGTSTPGAQNVGMGGTLAGTITAAGYTNYMVLQLHAGTTAAAGDTSLATFTLSYDET